MRVCMLLGVGLYGIDEEELYSKVQDHAKQYQGRAQDSAVPER
jgi:hypothetical protein